MFTRWLVFHVASGQSFFSGSACLIVAVLLSRSERGRGVRATQNILLALGGLLVFVSATPLPTWLYSLLAVATLLWSATPPSKRSFRPRLTRILQLTASSLWLAAVLIEIPYHLMPRIPRLGRPTLGVIGDSITAGMGDTKLKTWPSILEHQHGVAVHDHSVAGAGVASAMRQAEAVATEERLVLLEIGGNDILGGTSPVEFEAGLDRLLSAIRQPGRVIVMMELPLPPTFNAYGRTQRRLARRYGAHLVPKQVLLGILQEPGATVDSIHLSETGHRSMAEAIWYVLEAAFASSPGPTSD